MSVKSEQNFLKRERAAADVFFQPELLANTQKTRGELAALAREPISAATGRIFPAVASDLRRLLCAEGIQQLFNENLAGFQSLREAQVIAYWQALVYEAAYERDNTPDRFRRGMSTTDFGACLLAWHLGAPETAAAIVRRLAAQTRGAVPDYWRASTGALKFMARLYERATGCQLDLDWDMLPALEGYEVLLDPGLKGRAYEGVLEWACAEHISQSRQSKKVAYPFAAAIYAPMPIEIITWLKLRRRDGLEHATHGHPLLESTLAMLDPPPSNAPKSDLLLLFERGIPHMQAYLSAAD